MEVAGAPPSSPRRSRLVRAWWWGGVSSRVTRGQAHLQPRVGAQRRGDRGDAVVADTAAAARELEQLLVGSERLWQRQQRQGGPKRERVSPGLRLEGARDWGRRSVRARVEGSEVRGCAGRERLRRPDLPY